MDEQNPHGKNLRKGRRSIPAQTYLVTTATFHRIPIFHDLNNGRIVARCIGHQEEKGHVTNLAFVIMPDHIHWLFSLSGDKTLSTIIAQMKSFSSRFINDRMNLGHKAIWQAGFHDHALRKEEDLRNVARYIIANPLRAGLAENIGDYPLWDAYWL